MTDLRNLAGDRYRVRDDGTADLARGERAWCLEIPGKLGTIYPCGFNGDLAVWTALPRMARRLAGLGLRRLQAGAESSYRFPVSQLDRVAAMIRAKRRRQLSPERRAEVSARLPGTPFAPLRKALPELRSYERAPGGVRVRNGGADAS